MFMDNQKNIDMEISKLSMSNQDADLRPFAENVEKRATASESSSSSSDGSNEPNSDQFAPSNFQRPRLTLESGMTSFPAISMTQSHQGEGEASRVAAGGRMFQLLEIPEQDMNNVPVRNLNPGLGIANNYHGLFPFDSSSTLPHSPILRTERDGFPLMRQSQHQLTMHDPSATFGAQEYTFQNLLGQGIGSNCFHPNELENIPIQKRMGLNMGLSLPTQFEGTPNNSNGQMKMNWQDNIPTVPNLHPFNLLSQQQGQPQSYGFPSNTRFRNTVYDPMYEAMGLPIDPHIRMFMARRDNGDEQLN